MTPAIAVRVDRAIELRHEALELKVRARCLELNPIRTEEARTLFRRAHAAWQEAEELLAECDLR